MKYFISNIYFAAWGGRTTHSPSPVLLLLQTEAANGEEWMYKGWVRIEEVKFLSVTYCEGAEGD